MAAPTVGIDLGQTNSAVAVSIGGRPQVLHDASGGTLIPSVVSFSESGELLVGFPARLSRTQDPKNTVYSVKRLLGRPFKSEEVRRARSRVTFDLKEGPDSSVLVGTRAGDMSLPELSAYLLSELRRVAEAALRDRVEKCVVTVPAHFNELQRSSTKVAGRIAELDVVRILNEPTAAALAYGYGRGTREKICVFDFGGGTFDVTLLELSGNVFEVLATAGDTFLGGDDIDMAITDSLLVPFQRATKIDPMQDRVIYNVLRDAAETAKCELSTHERSSVAAEFTLPDGRPVKFSQGLTRAELERLATPFISRTFDVCSDALKLAGLRPMDLTAVILVGGSTRIPSVRQRVASFFSRDPRTNLPPEQTVAMGASILAEALTLGSRRAPNSRPPTSDLSSTHVGAAATPEPTTATPSGAPQQRSAPPPVAAFVSDGLAPPHGRVRQRVMPPPPLRGAEKRPETGAPEADLDDGAEERDLAPIPGIRPSLATLRLVLADLFPFAPQAQLIASDIGVPLRAVSWQVPADAFWFEIIEQARRMLLMSNLFQRATRDYPDNSDLRAATEAVRLAQRSGDQLESLLIQRDEAVKAKRPSDELNARIKQLKQSLRSGPSLRVGEDLGGRFRLMRVVGHGGFAVVWEAWDRFAQQRVAVKVLHGHLSGDRSARDRFARGARAIGQLNHANIVRIVDQPRRESGFSYFAMEYASGGDLREAAQTGRFATRDLVDLVIPVGWALHEVHQAKMVHRDVKPANILLREDGVPLLSDFDLVSMPDTTNHTRTNGALGTLHFLPPEALNNAKALDAKGEVYSLGMTLLVLLARRDLHVRSRPLEVLGGLAYPERLKDALCLAIADDRSERYDDVAAFCRALVHARRDL